MPDIHYLIGDATDPVMKPAVICHVCNSIGAWGRGFVMSLSKRNKTPEEAYRAWYLNRHNLESEEFSRVKNRKTEISDKTVGELNPSHATFVLGNVQVTPYVNNTLVANMIAQEGIQWVGKVPPIRYDALESCLRDVYTRCDLGDLQEYTVSMPRIGCELAGGTWSDVVDIIQSTMTVDTYVYTIPSQVNRWKDPYENAGDYKD